MNTNTLPGKMYIVVTDYMNPDTGEDVSDKIREIIDNLIVNGVTPSDDIYTKYLKGYINYD